MQEDLLNSGILYWYKSNRKGRIPIPIHLLSEEQKEILREGLETDRYEECNPFELFKAHYVWQRNRPYMHALVTDVEISPKTKRHLSPRIKVPNRAIYRFTPADMKRMIIDLKTEKIDESYAYKILTMTRWEPWKENDWKLRSDPIKKEYCEKCGSNENLVLQHTKQPRKVNQILYGLTGERWSDVQTYIEEHKNTVKLSFPKNTKKVEVCPKCGSSQIHLRITGDNKGTYVCRKTRNYEVCNHKFIVPHYGYDEKDKKEAEKARASILRYKFCEQEGLLRKAVDLSLEEIIEYLNFDHTKTLCNKCAVKEDRPDRKYY